MVLRYCAAALVIILGVQTAVAEEKRAPAAVKKEENLPVFEYNENYPIYQDYYKKSRSSLFRNELDALKAQVEALTKGNVPGNNNAALLKKMEAMQAEINELKAQNKALLLKNGAHSGGFVEGAMCLPARRLF